MTMLDLIVKEYIAIVDVLAQDIEIENNRIIVEREMFKKLLERNAFATFTYKTKVYKDLNFIIHDNESYTMPYKAKGTKKTVRMVIINYKVYRTIKQLFMTVINP